MDSVSYIIISYNQQAFIEEALRSAFNQDYAGPVEYIVSDDGSTDKTGEVIARVCAEYAQSKKISIIGDGVNRGIGGNLNRAISVSTGGLLVFQAGDDVAHSSRVSKVCNAFAMDSSIQVVYSNGNVMDGLGKKMRLWYAEVADALCSGEARQVLGGNYPPYTGFTECVRRKLFDVFGPFHEKTVFEDLTILFRAQLIGASYYMSESLMDYRVHSSNVSYSYLNDAVAWELTKLRRMAVFYEGCALDVDRIQPSLAAEVQGKIRETEVAIRFLSSRWGSGNCALWGSGLSMKRKVQLMAMRLLPGHYDSLNSMRQRLLRRRPGK